MVVAVTGASGQLGQALRHVAAKFPLLQLHFATSAEADITNLESLEDFFSGLKPDACINAAAYTAVDKAESEQEQAFAVNVQGVSNLAQACRKYNTLLVHISTDFVFDGTKTTPYTEEDATNPQSVYGKTKLQGEIALQEIVSRYYIIRTSWVYSQFANNFMKTMLRFAAERDTLNVVHDQQGTPTNACDLAEALLQVLQSDKENYGIYHYSNEGACTWYEFARKIFELNNIDITLNPIPTASYPTPAMRPPYSVLDKSKIRNTFGLSVRTWEEGLAAATKALHHQE